LVAGAANIAKKKWYWARDAGAPPDEKFGFEIGERESQREICNRCRTGGQRIRPPSSLAPAGGFDRHARQRISLKRSAGAARLLDPCYGAAPSPTDK
jgi:hypothetical protein